eukprot:15439048-Alexandrium_andersonii.AAC.1
MIPVDPPLMVALKPAPGNAREHVPHRPHVLLLSLESLAIRRGMVLLPDSWVPTSLVKAESLRRLLPDLRGFVPHATESGDSGLENPDLWIEVLLQRVEEEIQAPRSSELRLNDRGNAGPEGPEGLPGAGSPSNPVEREGKELSPGEADTLVEREPSRRNGLGKLSPLLHARGERGAHAGDAHGQVGAEVSGVVGRREGASEDPGRPHSEPGPEPGRGSNVHAFRPADGAASSNEEASCRVDRLH